MSKKTNFTLNKKRDKIHSADECGICAKPKTYKRKQLKKDLSREQEHYSGGPWGDGMDDPWGDGRIG